MANTPKVVHVKKEFYDVYVGRPSKWGNPFVIGEHGTRSQIIAKYKDYLMSNHELLAQLPELTGKTLACWCHPQPCHADILLALANPHNFDNELFSYPKKDEQ
jgi:hypothetical protein